MNLLPPPGFDGSVRACRNALQKGWLQRPFKAEKTTSLICNPSQEEVFFHAALPQTAKLAPKPEPKAASPARGLLLGSQQQPESSSKRPLGSGTVQGHTASRTTLTANLDEECFNKTRGAGLRGGCQASAALLLLASLVKAQPISQFARRLSHF